MNLSRSEKAGIMMAGNILEFLIQFLSGILIVRLITRTDYGTFSQTMMIMSLAPVFFSLGISNSIYYFFSRLDDNQRFGFIIQSILVLLLSGIAAAISCYFLAERIGAYFGNPALPQLLRIASLAVLFSFPSTYLQPMLLSKDRFTAAATIQVLWSLLIQGTITGLLFFGMGLDLVFASTIILNLLKLIAFKGITLRIFRGCKASFKEGALKEQLRYCLPLAFSQMLPQIASFVDRFVISIFFSPARFAVYSVGAFRFGIINMLPNSVATVLLPQFSSLFAEGNAAEVARIWHSAIRKLSLIILPLFVLLFSLGDLLITTLYTANYQQSAVIFRIYLFTLPMRIATYQTILMASGYTYSILKGSLIYNGLNLVLNLALVKAIGFTGPAVATVLVSYVTNAYWLKKIGKILKLRLSEIFPWAAVLRVGLVSVGCGAATYPLRFIYMPASLTILVSAAAFFLLYLAVIYTARMITPSEVALLKRWVTFRAAGP